MDREDTAEPHRRRQSLPPEAYPCPRAFPTPLNADETLGLATYPWAVALAVVLLFGAGEPVLGVVAPMASGVLLVVYTAVRISSGELLRRDVAALLKTSAVIVLGPTAWYLRYGRVFGCPSGRQPPRGPATSV